MGHNSWKPSLTTLVRFAESSAGFRVTRREQFVLWTNISPHHPLLSLPSSPGQGCVGLSFGQGCTGCPSLRTQVLCLAGLLEAQCPSSSCAPHLWLHQRIYIDIFKCFQHFSWYYPSTGCGADKESCGWSGSGKILLGSHQLGGGIFEWKYFVWKTPAHCNGNIHRKRFVWTNFLLSVSGGGKTGWKWSKPSHFSNFKTTVFEPPFRNNCESLEV